LSAFSKIFEKYDTTTSRFNRSGVALRYEACAFYVWLAMLKSSVYFGVYTRFVNVNIIMAIEVLFSLLKFATHDGSKLLRSYENNHITFVFCA